MRGGGGGRRGRSRNEDQNRSSLDGCISSALIIPVNVW